MKDIKAPDIDRLLKKIYDVHGFDWARARGQKEHALDIKHEIQKKYVIKKTSNGYIATLKENANILISFSQHIMIPNGGLMLDRSLCPQIAQKDLETFRNSVIRDGVLCKTMDIPVTQIKPIQANLNKDKIRKLLTGDIPDTGPVIMSQDGYLLDGHHRIWAIRNKNPQARVTAYVFQCDINTLLGLARNFEKSFYKAIEDDKKI
jgi:hypothetical protein